jgi:4-hydroxybenzoate polyprenyltransferase
MSSETASGDVVLAWRQLLRIGNIFTAASNVIAGFLIVQGQWQPMVVLAPLVAASACLYAAGMVLNDAFDAELDVRERPERPIPSGRIHRRTAFLVGWGLLGAGIFSAWLSSMIGDYPAPIIVAVCLAITIVVYNSGLKTTWAGPWAMGWCRTLNVLLGGSAFERLVDHWAPWLYAGGVGAYTVGLTFLARRETGDSPQRALHIRGLVKRMIVGFIVIDAGAAAIAAGWLSGLAVLALVIPTLIAARRAPMT